jgi:hypothetical protein
MQEEQPRQRELKNVSYNYLVESCIDRNKSKIVLGMMEETYQDDADLMEDLYTNSDLEEKMITGILLSKNRSLTIKLTEAFHRNPTLTKKVIIENYSTIVPDEVTRRDVI